MKIHVTGENDSSWRDGLTLEELEQFVTAVKAVGLPRTQEVAVEIKTTRSSAVRKGRLKKITVSY